MSGSFDYVVVGAGAAGCVIANRLSADPAVSVCLVEAGPRDGNIWIHLPIGISQVIADPSLDWMFWTAPQAHLQGRKLFMPRGKTLGGSSSINAMVAVRGHPTDYDAWAAAGATGWAYADVLPYFRRAESFEGGEGNPFHGDSGPLAISNPRYVNPLVDAFIDAAVAEGLPRNDDFNGATSEGVGLFHVFEKNGARFSSADAYLHPIERRPNLKVETGALARRVLFDNRRARGVEVLREGRLESIAARGEVLLAAGAIGSPQLLMLSGVGPAEHLRSVGIDVVHDAAGVGANLQDHLDIHISTLEHCRLALSERPDAWARLISGAGRYLVFRDGELSTNVSQAGAFVRTRPELTKPDVQWHFTPVLTTADGMDGSLIKHFYGYTLACCGLSPKSRGTVRLASPDPAAEPIIDPNYLDEPEDLDVVVRGLELARRVLDQPALARHREREYEPGAQVVGCDALAAYVRARGATTYHPVGACRIGSDPAAPLTPDLKVRECLGLRVIDASVMPLITGGNTNGPTIMIAEKGADLVLADRTAAGAAADVAARR